MSRYNKPKTPMGRIRDLENKTTQKRFEEDYDPDLRPGPVSGVALDFRIREPKNDLLYIGVVTWNPIAPGTCQADIHYYDVQMRPVTAAGVEIEAGRRRKSVHIINDVDDLEADVLKELFYDIEHPKIWRWQARVRVIDKAERTGEWSDWTNPVFPHGAASPRPPKPQSIVVAFDKNEKDRHEPRWRLLVSFDEIPFWDVKPTGNTDKVTNNLNGAHGASVTEFDFSSTNGFYDPIQGERIFLQVGTGDDREIISYNSKTATKLLNVKRGQDGTAAKAWPDGTNVIQRAADAQEAQNDLRGYDCQIRRVNAAGNFITDANGKFVQRTQSRSWDKEDDDNDGKVRFVFSNVRWRHKWKVRARTRDRWGHKGDWTDWVPDGASYASPSDTTPPPGLSDLLFDVDRRMLILDWTDYVQADPDDADALHPDIAYFQCQVASDSGFTNIIRKDMYVAGTKKKFRLKKPGTSAKWARVRSVDASGNKSAWTARNTAHKKPGKVRNRRKRRAVRAVVFEWDAPNQWSDGTTTDFDASEVIGYKIDVRHNGVLDADRSAELHQSTKFRIEVPKDSSGWSADITALGHAFIDDGPEITGGTESPDPLVVSGSEIEDGAITYGKIASSMPASAPAGNYGAPVSDGATPPRYYLPSGPAGYKNGDWLTNTGESPPRVYKYESASARWYRITENLENIYADNIVGGTVSGVLISGNVIRTGPPGSSTYVEMSSAAADRLQWKDISETIQGRLLAGTSGYLILAGRTGITLGRISGGGATTDVLIDSSGLDVPNAGMQLKEQGVRVSTVGHGHTAQSTSDGHGHGFTSAGGHSHTIDAVGLNTNGLASGAYGGTHQHTLPSHGHGGSTGSDGAHGHSFSNSSTTHSHSVS